MTLQEFRSANHEDFFFAVISIRNLSWEEAKDFWLYSEEYPDGITATDALNIAIEEALLENNEPVTDERKKEMEEEIKNTITTHLEQQYETILLKKGDVYIDLSQMTEVNPEHEIKFLHPIKSYYKKTDYSFEENENGISFEVDLEPFDRFCIDYVNGKFN